ncbi:uncharacterized protein LOC132060191 isoform X2 [Lycium ferocissimum]|uniref:uncharacterized protein LOC132060191 isoform X2 n=1 Tax=Lycium ferocissimum TaxID=112874 RepID=UPI002814E183|nr:uncharacterized protein LOC132060191 isoform X2 [Lycium ferocissimum]
MNKYKPRNRITCFISGHTNRYLKLCPKTMAGVLNISLAPISAHRKLYKNKRVLFVKSMTQSSDNSVSTKEEVKWFSAPLNFKAPKPKPFTPRSDKIFDILGASLGLVFRLGTGIAVSGYSASFVSENEVPSDQYALGISGFKVKESSKVGPRPEKPIEIYEFERYVCWGSVREIVAVLDLDVLFYPCPRNGPNFRPKVGQMGGKQQFPYMVDPNTGVAMYESDAIIKYLVGKYGDGNVPFMLSLGLFTTLTAGFAMIGRMGKGSTYTPSKMPPKPIELWAYEPSPFCKVVREVLVELELPHIQHSCARGSPKRQEVYKRVGHFQVPYLEDPNTGVQMFESADIVEYIQATYAL